MGIQLLNLDVNIVEKETAIENIVGKGEIACYEQFPLYHNVFKRCLLLMRQNEYLWSKGLK